MLKVIAEDFIHPEHIETVMPWYRELVEKTRQEPLCISYELCIDQQDPGHFILSKAGRIVPPRMCIVRPSISPGWCHNQSASAQALHLPVYAGISRFER